MDVSVDPLKSCCVINWHCGTVALCRVNIQWSTGQYRCTLIFVASNSWVQDFIYRRVVRRRIHLWSLGIVPDLNKPKPKPETESNLTEETFDYVLRLTENSRVDRTTREREFMTTSRRISRQKF